MQTTKSLVILPKFLHVFQVQLQPRTSDHMGIRKDVWQATTHLTNLLLNNGCGNCIQGPHPHDAGHSHAVFDIPVGPSS